MQSFKMQQVNSGQQINSGSAYVAWCLCLFGICGGQRFYTGNAGLGIIAVAILSKTRVLATIA